jgi:ribose 1,5-bisphosphokinase
VVANVSRTVIEALRRAYADVVVILITAPAEILAERLAVRARSSDGRLADRLGRAVDDAATAPDVTIANVGSVEQHARELVRVIKGAFAGGKGCVGEAPRSGERQCRSSQR